MTDKQAPQNTLDEIDEILNNLLRNGLQHMHSKTSPDEVLKMYVGSDDYNAYKHILLALITAARIETEKAYGGCHKCYGKGYATTLDYSSGYGTDGDIGGYEGPIRFRNNIMRYCTCDRGKQLATLTNDKIEGEHGDSK